MEAKERQRDRENKRQNSTKKPVIGVAVHRVEPLLAWRPGVHPQHRRHGQCGGAGLSTSTGGRRRTRSPESDSATDTASNKQRRKEKKDKPFCSSGMYVVHGRAFAQHAEALAPRPLGPASGLG